MRAPKTYGQARTALAGARRACRRITRALDPRALCLALVAAVLSVPTFALAWEGGTDVTVRGVMPAPATTSVTPLAQTGISSNAWFLVAAGVVLATAAIASLIVLRRDRHGH